MSGCFVEASAGTGKTRLLVQQITSAIAEGVPVDRIAAVTFTHAAAGSMKLRVRRELEERGLTEPLQVLDRAFIGTIHAFCATLLRQRPVEAGIDPDFQELAQPEARHLFSSVFRRWIEGAVPRLYRALARLAWKEERDSDGPVDALEAAAWKLVEWRDYDESWERRPFDRESKIIELLKVAMEYRNVGPVKEMLDRRQKAKEAGGRDVDEVEAELIELRQTIRYLKFPGRERLESAIDAFRNMADADLAAHLRDELFETVHLYQQAKQRNGQLDFQDLLICTRNLLQHAGACEDLKKRYDRIFVDEFQDTDPLQAEILLLLCGEDRSKLFVAGDPKQSIYRFRRADAKLYRKIREDLTGNGAERRLLDRSARSNEAIQSFVNAAFADMPDYLPLTGGEPGPVQQPSIVALSPPHIFRGPYQSSKLIRTEAPAATAAFIDWLISKSGWKVRESVGSERVPIESKHICVLFRKRVNDQDDLTVEYARALEVRGIDHVLVGSKSFHKREEIGTLRAALRAIEWPDDELSVFATLRGSLFFIDDRTLLKFREQFGRWSPLMKMPADLDEEFAPLADALALLKTLHRKRNYRPVADTIRHLMEHTRAHAGFAFHYGGDRRLANISRLTDLARSFEAGGPSSFRAFIEYLEREEQSGEQSEAPILEQQAGGVKLMTVHKSKGLEFPVVILANLTTHLTNRMGADRYVAPDRRLCAQKLCGWAPWELVDNAAAEQEEDDAEGVRVAYVAATRALDLLVVNAAGAMEWEDSWVSPLYPALYPPQDQWRLPSQSPLAPVRGSETVLELPGRDEDATSVRPGIHRPQRGEHEVFWFDPLLLEMADAEMDGLDRSGMLRGEDGGVGRSAYDAWLDKRASAVAAGSEPQFRVLRASESRVLPDVAEIPFEVIVGQSRVSSRHFGRVVHAILQAGAGADVERLAALHGRRWNLPDDQITEATQVARAALAHPELAAEGAVEVHRELPVSVTLNGGEIVEGVIDLAWSDGTAWTVVDYKTGRTGKRHESQVRLYALAMQSATGLPARGVLVQI